MLKNRILKIKLHNWMINDWLPWVENPLIVCSLLITLLRILRSTSIAMELNSIQRNVQNMLGNLIQEKNWKSKSYWFLNIFFKIGTCLRNQKWTIHGELPYCWLWQWKTSTLLGWLYGYSCLKCACGLRVTKTNKRNLTF